MQSGLSLKVQGKVISRKFDRSPDDAVDQSRRSHPITSLLKTKFQILVADSQIVTALAGGTVRHHADRIRKRRDEEKNKAAAHALMARLF